MTMRRLLEETVGLAADYLERTPERPVGWSAGADELRSSLGGPLPEMPAHSPIRSSAQSRST